MDIIQDAYIHNSLPQSLRAWRDIDALRDPQWAKPWEALRPFFRAKGYELYQPKTFGKFSVPETTTPPALESFNLYGDRSDLKSRFNPFAQVFAARDRLNRDVVIKVISKGTEGQNERLILKFLNTEPLRSHPANATIPIVEFLDYQDYGFAVMPCCENSIAYPFLYGWECLDFAEQVLETLCFLHGHRIAHLDVSFENIMVNFYGKMPQRYVSHGENAHDTKVSPPPEWRSTFPVRYYVMDFGISARFVDDLPLSKCTVLPFPQGREHRAPETDGKSPFNPFAADVYQTASLFYAWFPDLCNEVPELLKLLQDMSSYNPSRRITASVALARLRTLRTTISKEKLNELHEQDLLCFYPVPATSDFVLLRDIVETGDWNFAFQYAWWMLKKWFNGLGTKQKND